MFVLYSHSTLFIQRIGCISSVTCFLKCQCKIKTCKIKLDKKSNTSCIQYYNTWENEDIIKRSVVLFCSFQCFSLCLCRCLTADRTLDRMMAYQLKQLKHAFLKIFDEKRLKFLSISSIDFKVLSFVQQKRLNGLFILVGSFRYMIYLYKRSFITVSLLFFFRFNERFNFNNNIKFAFVK